MHNLLLQSLHRLYTLSFTAQPRPQQRFYRFAAIVFCLSLWIIACTPRPESEITAASPAATASPSIDTALTIWWDKGFVLEEDEALQNMINQWEEQTGNTVILSLATTDDLPQKAQRALQAGNPPDLMMGHNAERVMNPRLAWGGELADVTDVIQPVQAQYPQTVLDGISLYNHVEQKRSYYAIPVSQAITQIFYRRDLLELAGKSEQDIPQEWDAFWAFWQQVQDTLNTKGKENIYALGLPLSSKAGDTYEVFEQILEAYNVKILDEQGNLLVDRPETRQGIINCLNWYSQFYKRGYVPTDAVNWTNADNNRQLLNRQVLMTPNNTLSIPAAVKQDAEMYYQRLGTIGYPNKPDGQPMRYLVIVQQAVIFNQSKHQQLAKDFLRYLLQPNVTQEYLKSGGRNLPVNQEVWQSSDWTDPADPHTSTAAKAIIQGPTRLFYYAQNPAYSEVLEENVWGVALSRIVETDISPEQAADEAIDRIKTIFEQWQ
jgi:multiple sugar transport system substrate-binding protein